MIVFSFSHCSVIRSAGISLNGNYGKEKRAFQRPLESANARGLAPSSARRATIYSLSSVSFLTALATIICSAHGGFRNRVIVRNKFLDLSLRHSFVHINNTRSYLRSWSLCEKAASFCPYRNLLHSGHLHLLATTCICLGSTTPA